ncbi:MAG: hypothetical protein HC908_10210 [Calothrix sp. SM1_7_51]|nr:hypothetical protein [Calothrix sp. SM1_7_51]
MLKFTKSRGYSNKDVQVFVGEIINYINVNYLNISQDYSYVISINSPNLLSTTYDYRTEAYIGLHFDNFTHPPVNKRSLAPVRVAINLGDEDRYFVYINLTLIEIFDILEIPHSQESYQKFVFASSLANSFMKKFPCYPVIKLRLKPGQGYIAPTQNIIHDGYTLGTSDLDINLMLRAFCSPLQQ